MKINYTILFSILLTANIAVSQTVEQKQTALFVKKTATWCNPCGTWGWTLFEDVWNVKKDDAVIIEMHNSSSSLLYSATAASIINNFDDVSTTPVFFVNGHNKTQYSQSGGIYTSLTKDAVIAAIDSTSNAIPVVNSGFTTSITGSTLQVDTKVKFFSDAVGEYYLGVYIAEENVVKYQSGIGNSAIHKMPLRGSVLTNDMGNLIVNGSVTANTEYTNTFSYTLNSSWNASNINVFTVIWKKVGGIYEYVNAYKKVSTANLEKQEKRGFDAVIFSNASSGNELVTLKIGSEINQNINIEVYDQMGKIVHTVFNGNVNSGDNYFTINEGVALRNGMYFVRVSGENIATESLKLIISE